MCNLYTMTATVEEMRRLFNSFDGVRDYLPPLGETMFGEQACTLAVPFPDTDMRRIELDD